MHLPEVDAGACWGGPFLESTGTGHRRSGLARVSPHGGGDCPRPASLLITPRGSVSLSPGLQNRVWGGRSARAPRLGSQLVRSAVAPRPSQVAGGVCEEVTLPLGTCPFTQWGVHHLQEVSEEPGSVPRLGGQDEAASFRGGTGPHRGRTRAGSKDTEGPESESDSERPFLRARARQDQRTHLPRFYFLLYTCRECAVTKCCDERGPGSPRVNVKHNFYTTRRGHSFTRSVPSSLEAPKVAVTKCGCRQHGPERRSPWTVRGGLLGLPKGPEEQSPPREWPRQTPGGTAESSTPFTVSENSQRTSSTGKIYFWGAWVAPTLEVGSGHDARVVGLSPRSGSALSAEPA